MNEMKRVLLMFSTWASICVTAKPADPSAMPQLAEEAARQLARAAESAMKVPLLSVMMKTRAPASGDRHDYASMGPYWWPDPSKPEGLPYIRRDGRVNPETKGERSDSPRLGRLTDAVEALAASWSSSHNADHARRAGELLRIWFIHPETRMNPNLEYSQGIPGICEGRGVGLIDGVRFLAIPESILRLRGAPGWHAADEQAMRRWFSDYLDWILASKHGREAGAAANNHGTWHDVQVVVYARFLGRDDDARRTLAAVAQKRIATQIAPDGSQPLEVARTQSWKYSLMNLRGLMMLARLSEKDGPDLWHFETTDGRGIRKALLYLAKHTDTAHPWPHPALDTPDTGDLLPLIAEAARVYPQETFAPPLRRRAEEAAVAQWRDFIRH